MLAKEEFKKTMFENETGINPRIYEVIIDLCYSHYKYGYICGRTEK